jgi:NADH-quinone oxidoreductase subunit M
MPFYALFFLLFTMAAVGLPGTSGFVGEFLALIGSYRAHSWVAFVATTGIILGAAYMLYLYWRVVYGTARTAEAAAMPDLTRREWALLAPIAAVVLWMGVYPESFMAPMRKDVETLMARIERAAPAGDAQLEKGAGMPKDAHGADAGHGAAPAHGAAETKERSAPDAHIAPPQGEAEVH